MELSPSARNLFSRATALAIGLVLAHACWRSVATIPAVARDGHAQATAGRRTSGVPYLIVVALATGLPAAALVGFAVVPTRWLFSIDPGYSQADGSDLGGVGGGWWI